jgi:predicted nucleic acid-binding protein
VILDTSFLIDLFDGREAAFERGIELSETKTVQRVPSPVVMELSYGAEFGNEDERRNVRNALRMYPVVEQNETIAHRAGQLLAQAGQSSGSETVSTKSIRWLRRSLTSTMSPSSPTTSRTSQHSESGSRRTETWIDRNS